MADALTTLRSLTQTAIDSALGFERSAQVAKSAELKMILSDSATKRRALVADLNRELVRLGGSAQESGSTLGAGHRLWLQITEAFERGDEAAAERVEEGEDHIEEKFREALAEGDFTPETRAVLQRAHAEIAESERMTNRLEDRYD